MVRYIDLTFPVEEAMPFWPGDSGPEFREVKRLEQDGYAVQTFASATTSEPIWMLLRMSSKAG
jgi:kynurenine formamidase